MKRLRQLLKMPMNDTCNMKESVRNMFFIGLFVAFFLWFFEPFGFGNISENLWLYALAFGGITFLTGLLVEFAELHIFRIRKDLPAWTFGKWLISTLILILVIALGNLLFASYLSGWADFGLGDYLVVVVNTLAIGIFPIILLGIWNIRKEQRKYSKLAKGLHSPVHSENNHNRITLPSQTGPDLQVEAGEILYIESSQNYLTICFLEDAQLSRQMIRNTLKEIRAVLRAHGNILQCHRSFLVNLDHVEDVSGNAQGLVLHLDHPESPEIPVSRTFIPAIRPRMLSQG